LGSSLNTVKTISRQRQAGHYDQFTNIGAGMRTARLELEAHHRPKAFQMMILMTDGLPNRTSTSSSPAQFPIDEAYLAKASDIKIMTISVGAGADTGLMQQIADITGGKHFNVPGGASVAAYAQDLKTIFGEIASDRPLKLIQVP
jgi:Mg-chelatase subunit ChlD